MQGMEAHWGRRALDFVDAIEDLSHPRLYDRLALKRGFVFGVLTQIAKLSRFLDLFRQLEMQLLFQQ